MVGYLFELSNVLFSCALGLFCFETFCAYKLYEKVSDYDVCWCCLDLEFTKNHLAQDMHMG